MEALASGYRFPEAPTLGPGGEVYFSDVLGGGVFRWAPDGEVETVLEKRRGIGGMCLHVGGGLVMSGRDVIHVRDGEQRVLLGNLEGVTGFNDLGVGADGRVFVGALRFKPFGGESPVPGDVWRISDAGASRIDVEVDWPNGIAFAPAGSIMYVCDYAHGTVLTHGSAGGFFARVPAGSADGMAVDERGGLWVATGEGGAIARFDPDGSPGEVVDVPASFVTSLCFGGDDMRDLYVTAVADSGGGTLFRGRSDVPGLPVAPASV